ncbi:MAG TPA: NADH-quinone oxidoreductase subunit C, partial [Candidatus Bathyarchaeia archaeon]|nr:NADH-quinone oxidoreductase subunit C [Candidatus Bathyarchaeia archaeon]
MAGTGEFLSKLKARFPGVLENLEEHVRNQYVATVPRDKLPSVVGHAVNDLGARFVITVAADRRQASGDFSDSYTLAFDREKIFLVLQARVPSDDLAVPSVTPEVPAADWSER